MTEASSVRALKREMSKYRWLRFQEFRHSIVPLDPNDGGRSVGLGFEDRISINRELAAIRSQCPHPLEKADTPDRKQHHAVRLQQSRSDQ